MKEQPVIIILNNVEFRKDNPHWSNLKKIKSSPGKVGNMVNNGVILYKFNYLQIYHLTQLIFNYL